MLHKKSCESRVNNFRTNKYSEYIISQANKATYIFTEIHNISKEMTNDFDEYFQNFILVKKKLSDKTSKLLKINAT